MKDRLRRLLEVSNRTVHETSASMGITRQNPIDEQCRSSSDFNNSLEKGLKPSSSSDDDRSTAVNSSLQSSSADSVDSNSSTDCNSGRSTGNGEGVIQHDSIDPPSLLVLDNDIGELLDDDPYYDVRERMDALCLKQRMSRNSTDSGASASDSSLEAETDDLHKIPVAIASLVYLSYAIMISIGRIRDFFAALTGIGRFIRLETTRDGIFTSDNDPDTFAPLLKSWEDFYTRRLYLPLQDVFNRPIASNPGSRIDVLERISYDGRKSMHVLGPATSNKNDAATNERLMSLHEEYQKGPYYVQAHDGSVARRCVNLGSYNYLGFGDDWQITCAESVTQSLTQLPISASSSCLEYGTTNIHRQVEETVAEFLKKEDAIVLTMGFNTNATVIPALVNKGDLIISDELNHTSIVCGARGSGAAIRVFRHNDAQHLEQILRESVVMGKPRARRPWNKILVIVEGIYSMEGEFCNLHEIVTVSKKYGAYVYLDEAHSIGATGITGRGCSEHFNVDTSMIDVMMGTFTKSFGGMGGYIAADSTVISMLRRKCVGCSSHNSLSPTVAQQVLTSFKVRDPYQPYQPV